MSDSKDTLDSILDPIFTKLRRRALDRFDEGADLDAQIDSINYMFRETKGALKQLFKELVGSETSSHDNGKTKYEEAIVVGRQQLRAELRKKIDQL